MTTNGKPLSIDAWQAESLRVTAFPDEVLNVERLSWWDDVVGFPPEATQSRPKAGQYQAQGDFEGRQLMLQVQPGRLDWNMGSAVKETDEGVNVPPLGLFQEALTSLLKIATPWLPQAPSLKRFAFGAVLVQPAESVRSGYVRLQEYLPSVRIDPDGSSDFFYQINRPRPTRISGLRMNRLTKWSVQVVQRFTLMIGTGGAMTRTLGQDAACRLELDVNTAPDFPELLPAAQLDGLLQEMVDLGREIAQEGDVP